MGVNTHTPTLKPHLLERKRAMVTKVEVAADAYLACLTHALSTEREEVMGLLLGEVIRRVILMSHLCSMQHSFLNSSH